jgi:signal transduction histidine kinase
MKRSRHVWILFVVCLAVLLAAMAWISKTALDARRQAALEENVRLALWRMDFALAPLVAQESARPYFVYRPFLPVDQAYARMFNRRSGDQVLLPSPLLGDAPPQVLLYFQFDPNGKLTSPTLPTGSNYDLAVPEHLSAETVGEAAKRLKRVEALADRARLLAMLPEPAKQPVQVVFSPPPQPGPQQQAMAPNQGLEQRGSFEFQQRAQAVAQSTNAMVQSPISNYANPSVAGETDVSGVPMTPLWIGSELILARRVAVADEEYVQGCLLDWPAIKAWLLAMVRDLLPDADLEPAPPPLERQARMLTALPARLIPGEPAMAFDGVLSPIELSLAVAWACVLVAAAAMAVVLWGLIRLSERRAAFVSAVTHELRTPLTTFHMYTEMLAEGMVPDREQQRDYLHTLRAEAARLSHLVENVLSYARLERGRADGRVERIPLGRLVDPIVSRLADRARQASMELVVDKDDSARTITVAANPSAVHQILFNLVDNACKYAADAADRRIHLSVTRAGECVELGVRDHGPGISRHTARRLFRSFSKSAHEAANSAPGIGLGLALSRRLARDMGGRLRLDKSTTDGARFVLRLDVDDTVPDTDIVRDS